MKNVNIKGMLVSIWSDGQLLEREATLDLKSGEVFIAPNDPDEIAGCLESEYFESDDALISHEICPICHEYVMRPSMMQGLGETLHEINTCANGCN